MRPFSVFWDRQKSKRTGPRKNLGGTRIGGKSFRNVPQFPNGSYIGDNFICYNSLTYSTHIEDHTLQLIVLMVTRRL